MDLRQLQTFVEVVDRGSFSAAADALGVSQPAVSQQIASLERGLGERVIDRSGRRARPTERGEVIYRHAVRMLSVRDELQHDLAADADELAGHLVVGASTGPGEHVLPGLLGRFGRQHTGVTVTLRVDSTASVVDDVLDRELEIGVVGARRAHKSLEFQPFLRDRVVLAVPAGHRFAGRTVSLEELVAEPQVVQQEGAGVRRVIESELRRVGVRPRDFRIAMEMGLQESAKSAVEAGYGVSFLSSTAIAKELALGTLETADVEGIDPVRDFYWVWLAGRRPSRLSERFVEWCGSELDRRTAQAGAA